MFASNAVKAETLHVLLYITAKWKQCGDPPKPFKRTGREINMLDQFNYALWVYNLFVLAGYCQHLCQPSTEKAHLKDTNKVITKRKNQLFMHCIIFPEPQGFFFSPNSNHSPVVHSSSSSQTGDVVNN